MFFLYYKNFNLNEFEQRLILINTNYTDNNTVTVINQLVKNINEIG